MFTEITTILFFILVINIIIILIIIKMVRLGVVFLNLARRKAIGLETRVGYISPENNAGIWHGAGVKSGFIETFSGKK